MDDGIRHFILIKNSIRKTNPPTFCKWNEIGHNNHGLKIEICLDDLNYIIFHTSVAYGDT